MMTGAPPGFHGDVSVRGLFDSRGILVFRGSVPRGLFPLYDFPECVATGTGIHYAFATRGAGWLKSYDPIPSIGTTRKSFNEVKPMIGTEQRVVRIRVRELAAAEDRVDPESLWLDLDVAPEDLIRLDPLDITGDMVDLAEQPELADLTLRCLPPRRFSLRSEAMQRRRLREGPDGERESPSAFVARLRAGGSS
jgi:hypothetical protein